MTSAQQERHRTMTDRRIDSTPEAPSRASLLAGVVLTTMSVAATVHVATGLSTGREVMGFCLGIIASGLLIGQTTGRFTQRGDMKIIAIREQARRDEEAAASTGTWIYPGGARFTARHDPDTGAYQVAGWLSYGWHIEAEQLWPDSSTLAVLIAELERDGVEWQDDEGTRSVRERLELTTREDGRHRPGWDQATTTLGIFPAAHYDDRIWRSDWDATQVLRTPWSNGIGSIKRV
jgi:hypothetical protein